MQPMPGTASTLGGNDSVPPDENIHVGVRYLRLALAAYNAGKNAGFRHNGILPDQETKTHIRRVLRYFQDYKRERKNPDLSSKSGG
jgi:soluble lytic murein transglycosylase-like protein